MADIIDTAAEIEELQRNAALSAHRINRRAVSAEHFEECGDQIPEPRCAAVPCCQTCAERQGVIELKNKQRGNSVTCFCIKFIEVLHLRTIFIDPKTITRRVSYWSS